MASSALRVATTSGFRWASSSNFRVHICFGAAYISLHRLLHTDYFRTSLAQNTLCLTSYMEALNSAAAYFDRCSSFGQCDQGLLAKRVYNKISGTRNESY